MFKEKIKNIPVIGSLAKCLRRIFKVLLDPCQAIHILQAFAYCSFHKNMVVKAGEGFEIRLLTDSIEEYNCGKDVLFEKPFIQLIMANLNEKDIVYDVGAMIGFHAMFFAQKACEVHSFEPSPTNMKRLKENIQHNGIDNIQTCSCAVSAENGYCNFYLEADIPLSQQNSISQDALGHRKVSEIEVPTITLDTYSHEHSIPTVIKMDIEGAEFEALKGATALLKDHDILLFIEIHLAKLGGFNASVDNIIRFFEQKKYEVKVFLERAHSKHICAFSADTKRELDLDFKY